MKPVTAVLIGAGQRGRDVYGAWALRHPDRLRLVAAADPDPARRHRLARLHDLPVEMVWESGMSMLAEPRLAELCLIASPDRAHHRAAVAALAAGYHVLLEKPMAATWEDTLDLVRRAETAPGTLQVAHVLRHTGFFQTLHQVVGSARLGEIVTVEHRENVAAWHMAHSFVRGNWARAAESSPMIVQKCCHDFDILGWNLKSPVRRLASAGSLIEFRPERAPVGATARCTDGCPVPGCPYDARRLYLDPVRTGWPVSVVTDDLTPEGRMQALRTGPYGVCAFRAGSDVVDQQTVLMELADGTGVTLVMHGHSGEEARTMRYDGTRATLRGIFGRVQRIEVIDHATGSIEEIPITVGAGGHGGGDDAIMATFLDSVRTGSDSPTAGNVALESHRLAFAAEEARISGNWVDLAGWGANPP